MSESSAAGPVLVRDLMTVGVPTCPLDTPLATLAQMMVAKGWEGVVVLEPEQGHAVGAITQDELVAVYARGEGEGLTAEDVMRPDLPTAPPDIPLTAAAQLMRDLGARVLYMTHHAGGIEYPAAWLTYTHLLRHLAGGDLSDLGARAGREAPLEAFLRRRDEARKRAGRGSG